MDSTQLIDQPFGNCLFTYQHTSHIFGQLPGFQHQLHQTRFGNPTMICDKSGDPVLNLLKIFKGLCHPYNQTIHPDRMDHHRSCWYNKGVIRGHRQRNSNRMTASQNQGHRGLTDGCNHLCNGKSALHIAAYRIDQHQQPLDLWILFHCRQHRNHMLIFGCLTVCGQTFMPFYFSDDREQLDWRRFLSPSLLRLSVFFQFILIFCHIKNQPFCHTFSQYARKTGLLCILIKLYLIYTFARACARSSMISCGFSIPTDRRIMPGVTPASLSCSSFI